MSWVKTLIIAAVVIALMYVMNAMMSATGFFGVGINDYQGRLLVFIAINIILATSLNLINGFTGQFSIGHAGFMAVGAYASAWFTNTYGAGLVNTFAFLGDTGASRDRKSTRLNSSHSQISYAVFCLKKKNK